MYTYVQCSHKYNCIFFQAFEYEYVNKRLETKRNTSGNVFILKGRAL